MSAKGLSQHPFSCILSRSVIPLDGMDFRKGLYIIKVCKC